MTIPRGPMLGQRHVLVFWSAIGLMLAYCMRVNMSVALVAMVDPSTRKEENKTESLECPDRSVPVAVNETAHSGEFQWSRELQGYILSSFYWGYFILQIPLGNLAQRHGGKWFFAGGVVVPAILTLLTPIAARASPYLIIALRVLEGLAESVAYPALQALLSNWVPREESSTLVTLALIGSPLGSILGQLTSGPLAFSDFLGGWPSIFYIDGAVALLWFLPWCFCVFDTPMEHPRGSFEERFYIHQSLEINFDESMKGHKSTPWRKMLCDPPVWAFMGASVCFAYVFNTILTTMPQFLSDVLHFDIKSNGIISALPYACMVACQIIFSITSDRIIRAGAVSRSCTKRLFSFFGFCGIAGCQTAVVFAGCDAPLTVALLCLTLASSALFYGGFMSNALDLAPEYAGTLFGIINSFANLSGIIAPIVTDRITVDGTRHQWGIVFYLSAGLSVFGAFLYVCMGSSERRYYSIEETTEPQPQVSTLHLLSQETKGYEGIQK